MPDIFDGPYSSSEEGVEVILQRDPASLVIAASTSPPPADDEQLETALFE
jgi:hypothetical protein